MNIPAPAPRIGRTVSEQLADMVKTRQLNLNKDEIEYIEAYLLNLEPAELVQIILDAATNPNRILDLFDGYTKTYWNMVANSTFFTIDKG